MWGRLLITTLSVLLFMACQSVHLPNTKTYTKVKPESENTDIAQDSVQNSEKGVNKPSKELLRLASLQKKIQVTPLIEKWHYRIKDETVRNIYICDDILLIETETNKVYGFDRENGIPKWIHTVKNTIDFAPEFDADNIYILALGNLQILDKNTGGLILDKRLSFAPCSPPSATSNYLFIGGWDNFLYALDRKTGEKVWSYRIDGEVTVPAEEVDGDLFLASNDENIYKINALSGKTASRWAEGGRFPTSGANVARLSTLKNPPVVYVGSRDYNLYCINRVTGVLNWKFESGGEINSSPTLIGNTLYVISDRSLGKSSSLFSLDAATGRRNWSLENAKLIHFQGKYNMWVVKQGNSIVSVAPESGRVKGEYDVSDFSSFVTNTNDKLGFIGYMATEDGYIFAVTEE